MGAVLAALDMTAQRPHGSSPWAEGPRSAALDRRHDLELAEAHMAGMGGTPSRPAMADVRHSTAGRDNGRRQPGIFRRKSSGLVTWPIVLMATRV